MNSKLNINIGMFFDGTGLNYVNTYRFLTGKITQNPNSSDMPSWFQDCIENESKESKLAIYAHPEININSYISSLKKQKTHSNKDFEVTAINYSNIYWLYTLYGKNIKSNDHFGAVYVEGVGTQNNIPDNNIHNYLGLSIGRGETGAIAKYNTAICYFGNQLDRILASLGDNVKGKEIVLTFDIFGFSRGAAIARHFANQILSYSDKNLLNTINSLLNKYECSLASNPSTNFLGLYETVVEILTIEGMQNPSDCPMIQSLPKGIAKHVFQIRALQESRENFPLHSISKYYPEVSFLGCHSDIGGSYADIVEEETTLTKAIYTLSKENASYLLSQDMNAIKNPYWTILNKISEKNIIPYCDGLFYKSYMSSKKTVTNMQLISLCSMLKVCDSVNVPFDPSGFNIYRQKLIKLTNLEKFGDTCIQKALDVFNGKQTTDFTPKEVQFISQNYTHISANWGATDDPTPLKVKAILSNILSKSEELSLKLPKSLDEVWKFIISKLKEALGNVEDFGYHVYEEALDIKKILIKISKTIEKTASDIINNPDKIIDYISKGITEIVQDIQYTDEIFFANRPTDNWERTIFTL